MESRETQSMEGKRTSACSGAFKCFLQRLPGAIIEDILAISAERRGYSVGFRVGKEW